MSGEWPAHLSTVYLEHLGCCPHSGHTCHAPHWWPASFSPQDSTKHHCPYLCESLALRACLGCHHMVTIFRTDLRFPTVVGGSPCPQLHCQTRPNAVHCVSHRPGTLLSHSPHPSAWSILQAALRDTEHKTSTG